MLAFLLPLLSNLKVWGALGLAALLGLIAVQTARLNHAKADLGAAQAALLDPATRQTWQAEDIAAQASLVSLRAAIDAQNQAVTALRADGAAQTAAAQQAVTAQVAALKAAQAKAAQLLAAQPGADGCSAARALILKAVGK